MHNVHRRTSAKALYINDLAHSIFHGKDVDEFHISQNFEGKAVNAYNWDSGRCMGRVKSEEGVQKSRHECRNRSYSCRKEPSGRVYLVQI